jgi:hypothetical protein
MHSLILQLALLVGSVLADDITVYTDTALRAGWENWSWGSDLDFAAADLFEGTSSISVNSQPYSALSLKLDGTFPNYQGLRFDIAVRMRSLPFCLPFSATEFLHCYTLTYSSSLHGGQSTVTFRESLCCHRSVT